ncbi:MAG: alpha/beta hydrolase [Opitutales bacterium]|nr:alpha/beta hydrolase [Opitutales bacterium]
MKKSGPWWSVWRVVRILLLSYAGLVGLLFFTQRGLIYFPDNYSEEEGIRFADRRGLEMWEHEGVFHGWKSTAEGDSAILIFHGNAGGGIHRDYLRDLFRDLPASEEHSVYILEYPGYGFRPGRPSEQTFREAAVEAYRALHESYSSLLLVGESIGGGVATWLAAEKGAEGVLLITPFNRLSAVAAYHYPWLPARWLLRDHFRNDEHLEDFDGPVAFVVAGEDAVIPTELARKLYESYDGPKLYRLQEGADHNTIYYGPGLSFWEEVLDFVIPVSESEENSEF